MDCPWADYGLPIDSTWKLIQDTLQMSNEQNISDEKGATSFLHIKEDEVMPPLTVRRIVCEVDCKKMKLGTHVVVEKTSDNSGLEVYDGCTTVEGQELEVLVANRSMERKLLVQGTVLAAATETKEKEEVVI